MRILVTTVETPFVEGGAESQVAGLVRALRRHGHQTSVSTVPFDYTSADSIRRAVEYWDDLAVPHGGPEDAERIICLKFPTYYLTHPAKTVWLLHQHRDFYDLWESELIGRRTRRADDLVLRQLVRQRDTRWLGERPPLTSSKTVSARLLHFNGLRSTPLYHPPPDAEQFHVAAHEPFLIFPSRLVRHKRQGLLLEAMERVRAPGKALIIGGGGDERALREAIESRGLTGRVEVLGALPRRELIDLYARCRGVFFVPYDEDYGYVTLEAMASSKPVVTCADSGGPTEFVVHGENGFVLPPHPDPLAAAVDQLLGDEGLARELGRRGRAQYAARVPGWDRVVEELLR